MPIYNVICKKNKIMITTKIIGLTRLLTKNKKAKIAILLIEIGSIAYALSKSNETHRHAKKLSHN